MISAKKLVKMARKWQKFAAMRTKRISFTKNVDTAIDKGHFAVYTADQKCFVIPLVYLNNDIFRVLLKMAEEEYGLPRDGLITLPCDAVFMDYAVSLIRRHAAKDLERELLTTITSGCRLSSSYLQERLTDQQLLVSSF
ncbi:Auxin-responsive protein SAUR66 [Camellia lanceoleosa]|uniref:Auxin-responsive protein SAUR66 n=1 Tax=Camellia lanceoleosa TaxID=1840588 RepID=A0ACC0IKF3_9ERIC|nr:Auxin-responsive protein SAUR66 [Camellia lanceoleosa]